MFPLMPHGGLFVFINAHIQGQTRLGMRLGFNVRYDPDITTRTALSGSIQEAVKTPRSPTFFCQNINVSFFLCSHFFRT